MKALLQKSLIFSMIEESTKGCPLAVKILTYAVVGIIFSCAIALVAGVFMNSGNIVIRY